MSCGVSHRLNLDPTLLWLWHELAASATAILPPAYLIWELLYATEMTLKKKRFCHSISPPVVSLEPQAKGYISMF